MGMLSTKIWVWRKYLKGGTTHDTYDRDVSQEWMISVGKDSTLF